MTVAVPVEPFDTFDPCAAKDCGSVTVADAQKTRPDIQIDNDPKFPERAKAQPGWWVHRKWIEELYDLKMDALEEHDLVAEPVFAQKLSELRSAWAKWPRRLK